MQMLDLVESDDDVQLARPAMPPLPQLVGTQFGDMTPEKLKELVEYADRAQRNALIGFGVGGLIGGTIGFFLGRTAGTGVGVGAGLAGFALAGTVTRYVMLQRAAAQVAIRALEASAQEGTPGAGTIA